MEETRLEDFHQTPMEKREQMRVMERSPADMHFLIAPE